METDKRMREEAKKYDFTKNLSNLSNVQEKIFSKVKNNVLYISFILYVVFVFLVFFQASSNPYGIFDQKYWYIAAFLLPLFGIAYLYFKAENVLKARNILIAAVIFVVLFVGYLLYLLTKSMGLTFKFFTGYFFGLLLFLMIVVGLAIFYKIFMNSAMRFTGWTGFIVEFLFFIPCLITDYLDYIIKEYQNTPNVIFILFIIEILLILSYLYLPRILSQYTSKNSVLLRKTPLPLDGQTIINNNSVFIQDTREIMNSQDSLQDTTTLLGKQGGIISLSDASGNMFNLTGKSDYLYTSNFALTMWIFVNGRSNGTKPIFLFKYGSPPVNKIQSLLPTSKSKTVLNTKQQNFGKPSITYIKNDEWQFNFSESLDTQGNGTDAYSSMLHIPPQKWNYIVFNYYDNQVDLFINGHLETNMDLTKNPIRHYPTDVITIGETNGLNGALCNLRFFKEPMKLSQITQTYNLLYSQNPPVNNLY